jgi:hypothetical protein
VWLLYALYRLQYFQGCGKNISWTLYVGVAEMLSDEKPSNREVGEHGLYLAPAITNELTIKILGPEQ